MKYRCILGPILLLVLFSAPPLLAFSPYIQLETGVGGRDVIEEGKELETFKFKGNAVTTRIIARLGFEVLDLVDLYVKAGGVDLSIDEFNDFNSDFTGAYGGGIRVKLYQSPHPDQFKIFVEANVLHFEVDDKVLISQCLEGVDCDLNPDGFEDRIAEEEIEWMEYAFMFGASGRMAHLSPFGGIRLSVVDGEDVIKAKPDGNFSEVLRIDLDLEEDDIFGIFFGTDIFLDRSEKTAVHIEATILDQDSIKIGIRRAF